MLCSARCSCFLCRELQSCEAADARKAPKKMCDNFILKKSDAWENSGALRFIRGAARLSVRHWQNRDTVTPPKPRLSTLKSTSCEQLYPFTVKEEPDFKMKRAPSTDRMKPENKSLFKFLGNTRVKKDNINPNPETKSQRSVLNFRKSEHSGPRIIHEKYIPLPQLDPVEHIYMEPRPRAPSSDDCCRPPIYQSVEKKKNDVRSSPDNKVYSNFRPCFEELTQKLSQDRSKSSSTFKTSVLPNKITQNNNRVVIYFGDSIIRRHSDQKKEMTKKIDEKPEEAIYANRLLDETDNLGLNKESVKDKSNIPQIVLTEAKAEIVKINTDVKITDVIKKDDQRALSSDGFTIVQFEENYQRASKLVDQFHNGENSADHHEATVLEDEDDTHCDWSYVQNWRKRPSSGSRPEESAWCGGVSGARALRVRVCPAPAPAHARPRTPPPLAHTTTTPPPLASPQSKASRNQDEASPISPDTPNGIQMKAVSAPSQLTVQSTPVRCAPPQNSYGLEKRPKEPEHHHRPVDNGAQNGARECNSSSDENRSSGHASMSDSGGADPGREEPRRSRQPPHHARQKHRPHNKLQSPWSGGGGLEDIRSAIKQLTLRSRDSSSTATSGASSAGGGSNHGAPEGGSAAENRRRRAPLVRQPSLDTVCTNVTSADEFVWVDSHNRLIELRCVPWTGGEVSRVLQSGRCKEFASRFAPDTPPRLAYLLQRALVRIAREAQRLSQNFNFCSKHEVASAFRIVLSTPIAESCIKGCNGAATMFATSSVGARRVGSSARARTHLAPGRFHRWMNDVRVAGFVHEYAAIYLCAGMETLLEEIALIAHACTPISSPITPSSLDQAIGNCSDLWGLLQPYSHLNAGRIASGALSLSRWESLSSLGSGSSSGINRQDQRQLGLSHDSGITTNGSGGSGSSSNSADASSVLLSTCAGSALELRSVLRKLSPRHPPLSPAAEQALYYYMRCSQLEHAPSESWALWVGNGSGALPPLGEWLRAIRAHGAHRSQRAPDHDDVMQAARLLLPHADTPPRNILYDESIEANWSRCARDPEELSKASLCLAQRALLSGRKDLIPLAKQMMQPQGLDSTDAAGLTVLMKAALIGDEHVVGMLLEAGADPNTETPGLSSSSAFLSPRSPQQNKETYIPPTAGWTALVYACAMGAVGVAKRLVGAGAKVDGAPAKQDLCTLTPLQMACGIGNVELVQFLLSHGADPFLSTQTNDGLCYSAAAQYGCYSAVAVCCAHGRRSALALVLAHGGGSLGQVLSLEEVLAEGVGHRGHSKARARALQDAMYCAAECDHLDITLELRAAGVPWSLHSWTLSLAAAADAGLDHVIDQLLQDFLQVCPSDDSHYSHQFIYECLPLLFNILRYSKKEGTVLLLADILCACFGWERVEPPKEETTPAAPQRVDVAYVNNPQLADVTFRVEGRLFYGHKIVLVSESPRLRAMLSPPTTTNGNNTPLVQINDIRYHIFEQVMKYLYSGGCASLDIPECDILEVLAAASFFQLLPLQRHCEARAAKTVDLHNLVSVYIHAKVYNATNLLEYCQGFLLQNMVALLTYDDSVKRLLFGKRLPGHNVLGALLTTLQKRLEARKNQSKTR